MNLILSFILSALRLATPLSYAALGGYFSERAGVVNIALEGLMLMGAFSAAAVAHSSHSAALGITAGVLGGILLAMLHAFLSIELKVDQIISGLAVNMLAMGLPPVISKALYGMTGGTPALESSERISEWFSLSPLVILSFVAAFCVFLIHSKTRFGQYVRFAGEHPEALESQGVSVRKIRWIAVLLSGAFCGLAGAYLSMDHGSGFSRNMTAGRGFIALAALILGGWRPQTAFFSALLFGAIEASQILLQGVTLPWSKEQTVPVQWIQMIPYIMTIVVLALSATRRGSRFQPPKALGKPLLLASLCFLLTGCNADFTQGAKWFNENIGTVIGVKLPEPKVENTKVPVAAAPVVDTRQVYAEFIRELYRDTLQRVVREDEFVRTMNVLEQGGHYEGLYNGIIYSTEYKEKEKGIAPVSALKLYSELMTQLLLDQKYDPIKIKENAEKPDVPKPEGETTPKATDEERKTTRFGVEKDSMMLPAYTLKRKLGEELIKTIDLKKEYREKLATWYGKITFVMNSKGVDFEIAQRNKSDEYYHYQWALNADEDRIKWECLHRIHRIINSKL